MTHPLDSAISELRGEVSHTLLCRHPGWWGSSEWAEVMSITRSQIAAIRCLENIRALDRLDGGDRIMVGRLWEALRAERARAAKAERELEARPHDAWYEGYEAAMADVRRANASLRSGAAFAPTTNPYEVRKEVR